MSKKLRIFDTNIFSSYKKQLTDSDIVKMSLSLVVFYELTATKIYPDKRRYWDEVFEEQKKNKTLVSPNSTDWQICSRTIWLMHRNNEGIGKDATAMQNDALICQSALSFSDETPFIVTDNIKHFALLADYLNDTRKAGQKKLEIISADEYFFE